jgi:hypothetical protein
VGRKCKERTPGERRGLVAGQENGYGQICMEIPRVNLDTGRMKRTTKQASKQVPDTILFQMAPQLTVNFSFANITF